MMRKALMIALASASVALGAGVATANVREGVDAWSTGDYKKAVGEWQPAAIAGDADAQFNLGQAYTLGRGVATNVSLAESWFRKAALQGHFQAEAKYGLVLFVEGKRADALPWLEIAAKRGEPRAQLVLGTMLFNGDTVGRDWPRAYALIVRSAASNMPRASEVQAQMDSIIPTEQRQQGLILARQYEADAQRPQLPGEIPGKGAAIAIRSTDLPPSNFDLTAANKPAIVALHPAKPSHAKPDAVATSASKPAVAMASGGWRVQLGAFGDPNNARKLGAQVGSRFSGANVSYVKSGSLTRVLVGPYQTKAAALAACGSVQPCVPVGS